MLKRLGMLRSVCFVSAAGLLAAVSVFFVSTDRASADESAPVQKAVYQADDSDSGTILLAQRGWGGGYRGGWGGGYGYRGGYGGYYRGGYGGWGNYGYARPYYGGSYGYYGGGYPSYNYYGGYYPSYGYGGGYYGGGYCY